jgi:hypothetical protein
MPPTQTQALTSTLDKLAKELCRQSKERQKREKANDDKIAKILSSGLKLNPGLQKLGVKFGDCCVHKPGTL